MALIILGNPAWWLAHLPVRITPLLELAVFLLSIAAFGAIKYVWAAWPSPRLVDLRQLKASSGRSRFASGFALGFACGFAIGFAVGLVGSLAAGIASGAASGATSGLSSGIASGLGLVFGLDPGQSSATRPLEIVRSSLLVGFASAPLVGFATALASGLTPGFADALAGGVTGGLTAALVLGMAVWCPSDMHAAVEQPLASLAAGKLPGLVPSSRTNPRRGYRLSVPSPRTTGLPRSHHASARLMLQRGVHKSVQALEAGVRDWVQQWNENPRLFVWKKTVEEILDSLARYLQRISGGEH